MRCAVFHEQPITERKFNIKKTFIALLALVMCISSFSFTAFAVEPEAYVPKNTYAIPLQGYITDADGTIIEIIGDNGGEVSPQWAPVARTFTLTPGQTFTSYQYAGSAFHWIGGETAEFTQGSYVNLKVQTATSVGGSRTNALNTNLYANDVDGVSLSTSQYGNIVYTNTTSSTISFYGYVIVEDR